MKKLISTLALLLALTVSLNVNAQSDNSLIGRARGAAHECLQPYHGNYEINASVETISICFVSGEINRVTFTASPKCSGNGPCPFFEILVATVEFDCDGNVASVNCTE